MTPALIGSYNEIVKDVQKKGGVISASCAIIQSRYKEIPDEVGTLTAICDAISADKKLLKKAYADMKEQRMAATKMVEEFYKIDQVRALDKKYDPTDTIKYCEAFELRCKKKLSEINEQIQTKLQKERESAVRQAAKTLPVEQVVAIELEHKLSAMAVVPILKAIETHYEVIYDGSPDATLQMLRFYCDHQMEVLTAGNRRTGLGSLTMQQIADYIGKLKTQNPDMLIPLQFNTFEK